MRTLRQSLWHEVPSVEPRDSRNSCRDRLKKKLNQAGVLASFASLEAALRADVAISLPADLEERLIRGVQSELNKGGGREVASWPGGNFPSVGPGVT